MFSDIVVASIESLFAKYLSIEPSEARMRQYLLDLDYFIAHMDIYETFFETLLLKGFCE